ncbi:MAG: class I SAM-dependent methyltransferase, partial [Actinomycetota bacterium]|nr:class I SAM-dependent methyltransferase [Actinomycetota bacterium]
MSAPDYTARVVRTLLGVSAHPGGLALTERLTGLMDLPPGARLADVACGSGASGVLLARAGVRVDGVDLEPAAVRRAVRAAARAGVSARTSWRVGDAHALPLPRATYDGVLCECSLSTFADPAAALAEMVRLLRPGGHLGLSDITLDRAGLAAAHPRVLRAVDGMTTARPLAAYVDLVAASGLAVAHIERRDADALALLARLRARLAVAGALSRQARA